MKVGDRVTMKTNGYVSNISDAIYTIEEIDGEIIKVKDPTIGGYFIFSKEMIKEIVYDDR